MVQTQNGLKYTPEPDENQMSLDAGAKKPWYILFNIKVGNEIEREKK